VCAFEAGASARLQAMVRIDPTTHSVPGASKKSLHSVSHFLTYERMRLSMMIGRAFALMVLAASVATAQNATICRAGGSGVVTRDSAGVTIVENWLPGYSQPAMSRTRG
jgi:hypothetical protein